MIREGLVAVVLALSCATAGLIAQTAHKEGHPVLERAMEQINSIKGRLQNAPRDFGGHKQKAIDALTIAAGELQQAMQFDK
jgi:hypothetical protein